MMDGAPVRVTETGLCIDAELTFEQWCDIGRKVGRVARTSLFLVGDWLIYGQDRWNNGQRFEKMAEEQRERYVEAFSRSSFEAMLNYYKANYPRQPYAEPAGDPPKVQCPVLVIHGLGDKYLLASGLNETWKWVDKDLTIVTVPDADHFVQHDRPEFVTKTMANWLRR